MTHKIKLIPKMLGGGRAIKRAVLLLRRFRDVQNDLHKSTFDPEYTKSVLVRDGYGNVKVKNVNSYYQEGIPNYEHLTKEKYYDLMRQLEYAKMHEGTLTEGSRNATRTIEEILSHEIEIGKLRTRDEIEEAAKILFAALGGAGGYYLYNKYINGSNGSYDNYVEQRPDEDFSVPNFENGLNLSD